MTFIVVTGTPGTGKTTFSKTLAKTLGFKHLDVGELCMREGYILEYDGERATHVADLEKLRKHVKTLEKANYVLNGHLSHLAAPPESVRIVYVLRCHPEVLKKRLEAKGYPPRKVHENVMAEILDVCLIEALEVYGDKVCEIDSTGKPVEKLVSEALAFYRGEAKPKTGMVNWVLRLKEEGLLENYLKSDLR